MKIKVKRDVGFLQYQLLGILSLFLERGNDYFVVTNKRILVIQNEKAKVNLVYNDFSTIKFNAKTAIISFKNKENEIEKISLSKLKLDYEDYQYLKSKLNF